MNDSEVKDEVVIDSSNFANYFFDVRKFGPKPGQIMARFSAIAVFGDGPEKMDLIKVLRKGKAESAAQVMRKIHCAAEPDCYRVCREICEDLISGMTDDQVCKKEYSFLLEAFYYTKKDYVPKNDPNWEMIDLMSIKLNEDGTYKCDINI